MDNIQFIISFVASLLFSYVNLETNKSAGSKFLKLLTFIFLWTGLVGAFALLLFYIAQSILL